MAKCNVCGKNSIFLRTDTNGLCRECVKRIEDEENQRRIKLEKENRKKILEASSNFYIQLVNSYQEIKSEINLNSSVSDIEKKIKLCESILSSIDRYVKYDDFESIFSEDIIYENDMDKRLNSGKHKYFNLYIWTNKQDYISKAMSDLKQLISKHIEEFQKLKMRMRDYEYFNEVVNSLQNYTISLQDYNTEKYNVSDIAALTYSNITSKSNYDKLGTFISIDVETTGLKCAQDNIIEISAVLFESWIPKLKFETLIKPPENIPPNITSLTSITNEMVENSPTINQVIPSLLEFISNRNIVGHNLPFDLKFLYKNGLNILQNKRKYYDTLRIAQKTLKGSVRKWDKEWECYDIDYDKNFDVENYKLDTLCDFYDIRDNSTSHRALSDCVATGLLFKKLAIHRTI